MTTGTLSPAFLDADGLLRLMSWLSPAFPVGGFSYSHGIEYAVEAGLLTDRATVEGWIATILGHGAGWVDAVLFLAAHRAVTAGQGLAAIVEMAEALRGTPETALEAKAQGTAFLSAVRSSWPQPKFEAWLPALGPCPSYAVVVAVAAACAGVGEAAALTAFLHCLAANLVSAAVRLVPLGQTDGQRALRGLAGQIPAIIARAMLLPFEDLGSAAPMADWTSMRHETQYTRLFRS
jgi:urease accessory protein